MNERLPVCQNCPLAERLPTPLRLANGTVKEFTCLMEQKSAEIVGKQDKINLPQLRNAYSILRRDMHRQKCPESEIKRLTDAQQRDVDATRRNVQFINGTTPLSLMEHVDKSSPRGNQDS